MKKRCVCGRSTLFPLCDGSHRRESWACAAGAPALVERCFVAGKALENLAELLAEGSTGVAYHRADGPLRAREVVVLTDGTDLDGLTAHAAALGAETCVVLAFGVEAGLLEPVFVGASIRSVQAEDLHLARAAQDALEASPIARARRTLAPAFVSHAVADEPRLAGSIAYLRRHFAADLFVCADSIAAGADWHHTILTELDARPLFLALVSRDFKRSAFSAFEVGYAVARAKRVVAISLDGELPPSYMQHVQMADLPRLARARPWMDERALLVDAMLAALGAQPPAAGPPPGSM